MCRLCCGNLGSSSQMPREQTSALFGVGGAKKSVVAGRQTGLVDSPLDSLGS